MKRYLVTLTGRTNLIVRAMRDNDVCDCYVYAHSQKEAISKFWEQLEKNHNLSAYTRRDFKITAERWEKGELDMYGEPMSDLESAIPFDLLAVAEWKNDHSYKLTAPETAPETESKEMNQPEPEKVTESHTEPQRELIKVDMFSIQVGYTGTFESHSIDDWTFKAQEKALRCDCYDKTIEVSDHEAKRLDGSVRVSDTYPCNKIATVFWAYIREEE